jgi:hypothetical protein
MSAISRNLLHHFSSFEIAFPRAQPPKQLDYVQISSDRKNALAKPPVTGMAANENDEAEARVQSWHPLCTPNAPRVRADRRDEHAR